MDRHNQVILIADMLEGEFPEEPYWSLMVIAKNIVSELSRHGL